MSTKKTTKKPTTKSDILKQTSQVKPDTSATKKYSYNVESGVAISGVRHSKIGDKFPFAIMKPGDSFLIPANDPAAKNPNVLHYAAKNYAKMVPGFTITTRLQLNKSRRVWRLK